jgi:hypothetical protein
MHGYDLKFKIYNSSIHTNFKLFLKLYFIMKFYKSSNVETS